MQTLALENYGVQEMNYSEMKTIDGGDWIDKAVKVLTIAGIACAGAATIAGLIILLTANGLSVDGDPYGDSTFGNGGQPNNVY